MTRTIATGNDSLPPTLRGWDVYAITRAADPHAEWARIREEAPVFDSGGGVFFVSRWALVNEVLRDARHRAGAGVEASFIEGVEGGEKVEGEGERERLALHVMRAWLMSLDGAPHVRARGLVRREFTPRRVEALEPMLREIVNGCVQSIESTPPGQAVDLVEALAFPIPSQVIRRLFGLDARVWAEEVEPIFLRDRPRSAEGVAMIEAVSDFFDQQMKTEPLPEGLLKALCVPDPELGALDRLEVIANAVLLVTAAIDTTKGLIGNALRCLLDRPELVRHLRERPELIPAAIEETLRFEPPALSCSRFAQERFVLGGIEIPARSQLLLGLAAANRDPERYASPDRFDLDRDQTGLLSFGGGRHFCLGAALARSEGRIALERLLVGGRCDYEPIAAPVWDTRNPTVRALEALPVRVHRRAGH